MRILIISAVLFVTVVGGALFAWFSNDKADGQRDNQSAAAPVEVSPVEHGTIVLRRTFSGTLESPSEFIVAPKIDGRIVRLYVDVSDPVKRGQIVAELDSAEYVQAVMQAEAELSLAKANLTEARNNYTIAQRESKRISALHKDGITSESQMDAATADELAKESAVAVAEAQVTRAQANLEAARIRLGYTKVPATWSGGDDLRIVSQRLVNEGATVAANAPLLSVVELDPIHAVVYVTEKDYGRLKSDQTVTLKTDAHPGRVFEGKIARIAPIFRQASRQARVEVTAPNPKHELKPGMFIRAEVVMDRVSEATIVPTAALTTRNDVTGVFVVNEDGKTVAWRRVEAGIREDGRVQVKGERITGRVVTLGQQLIDDGSAIIISTDQHQSGSKAGSK